MHGRVALLAVLAIGTAACSGGGPGQAPVAHARGTGGPGQLRMIDAQNGWAWGPRLVTHTLDGGQSFADVTPPGIAGTHQVMDVWANGATGLWLVVGSPAGDSPLTIDVTSDGGGTWTQAGVEAANGASITTLDARNGWVILRRVSADGRANVATLLASTDGGRRWSFVTRVTQRNPVQPSVAGDCQWGDATFTSPQVGFIGLSCPGGDPPRIDVTRDGGRTWQRHTLAPLGGLSGTTMSTGVQSPVFFSRIDGLALVWMCVGSQQTCTFYVSLYRTADGGSTWYASSVVRGSGGMMVDLTHAFVPFGCLVTAPCEGDILRTGDGGSHWDAYPLPAGLKPNMHASRSFDFVDATHGFAIATQPLAGPQPTFYRTNDGGRTFVIFRPRLP